MSADSPARPNLKRCAGCGARFDCGAERGSCWCNELPPLPAGAIDPALNCYCPACLRARVARAEAAAQGPLQ